MKKLLKEQGSIPKILSILLLIIAGYDLYSLISTLSYDAPPLLTAYAVIAAIVHLSWSIVIRLNISSNARNGYLVVSAILCILAYAGFSLESYYVNGSSYFDFLLFWVGYGKILTLNATSTMLVATNLMLFLHPSDVISDTLQTKRAKRYMARKMLTDAVYSMRLLRWYKLIWWLCSALVVMLNVAYFVIYRVYNPFSSPYYIFYFFLLIPMFVLTKITMSIETKSAYILQADMCGIDAIDNETENTTESEVTEENTGITKKRSFYRCAKCGRPLSTFDILFYQKLKKEKDKSKCQCFGCASNSRFQEIVSKLDKRLGSKCIIVHLLPVILLSVMGLFAYIGEATDVRINETLGIMFGVGVIICSIVCGIIVVRRFGLDFDVYESGEHYESTIQDDGKITTRRVTEYSGGTGVVIAPILVLTFIVWSVPHLIYLWFKQVILPESKYRVQVPEQIRTVYDSVRQFNKPYYIPDSYRKAYIQQQKSYNNAIQDIQNRYSMLGENEVKHRISSLGKPYLLTTFNGTRAVLVGESNYKENVYWSHFQFLLYIDEDGKFQGVALVNGRVLYSEADYMDTWRELALIKNIDTTVNEAKLYLKRSA